MTRLPVTSPRASEPIFNLPPLILLLVGILTGVHLWTEYGMNWQELAQFIWRFGFVPAHFFELPFFDRFFSLFSYSFLHGDWTHLGFNLVWLVIFGAPLSQKLGTLRFLLFWLACAASSALAYFVVHPTASTVVIGASGVISGLMGAAARYGFYRQIGERGVLLPLLSMRTALLNKTAIVFFGIWIGANIVVGMGAFFPGMEMGNIAWESHIGGLIAGFLLIDFFDKVSAREKPAGFDT